MDFQKLDPALAAAVSEQTGGEPDRDLLVFVHVSPELSDDDAARLTQQLNLERPVRAGGVLTMALPARRVGELSDEPWVVAIRPARRLRPLDQDG